MRSTKRNPVLLTLALTLAWMLLLVSPALAETGGSCGEGLTWSFQEGTLTVRGAGPMADGAFWKSRVQAGEIERVVIGDGVTRIGEGAFSGCGKLRAVSLPDSVTVLGEEAFAGCESLKKLRLPGGITEIGYQTFPEELHRLELPEVKTATGMTLGALDIPFCLPGGKEAYIHNHTETGQYIGLALYAPPSRTAESLTLPAGVDCIREGFFEGMKNLKSIRIPDTMTKFSIGDFAGLYRECVIHCGKGSAAERFCLEVGLQFDNGERRVVGYKMRNEKEKIRWIVRNYTRKGMSEKEKARVLHNWITTNCHYDRSKKQHSEKTLLLDGYGVCEAYSDLYHNLLTEAGIASAVLTSDKINHAWNLVRIDNRWYHVDVTWDDSTMGPKNYPCVSGHENDQYFLLGDQQIRKDHDWEEKFISADRGWLRYYYEPKARKIVYRMIWSGTNYYLLDLEQRTAMVLEPAFGHETKIVIPASFKYDHKIWKVTSVWEDAFRNNKKITSLVIGKNVRRIGKNAFRGCGKLREITVHSKKLNADNVGASIFGSLSEKAVFHCPETLLKDYQKLFRKRGVPKKVKFRIIDSVSR